MSLFNEEYLGFVERHRSDDPSRLRLRYHGDPRPWMPMALENIEALKKCGKFRLSEEADLTPAVIPLAMSAQQATSARVALLHANLAKGAERVLDMTFGLGMDARMLAMNPLRNVLGFDLREELVEAAAVNFANNPNVEVRQGDSVEFLSSYTGTPFDLIFIDPARRGDAGRRLFNLHDCQPDLIALLPAMKRSASRVMAKLSPMLDVSQTITDLPGIAELHIVEENRECKELFAIIDFREREADDVILYVDRLLPGGIIDSMEYTLKAERDATPLPLAAAPSPGNTLYEPSAAAMKSAPFRLMSARFSLEMLHPNSHLYISRRGMVAGFPGRAFEIVEAVPFSSSAIKRFSKELSATEIAARNLKGFTADTLRRKLRLPDRGPLRLYATTIREAAGGDLPYLILTRPLAGE